ncbi:MAG: hypothetical protein GY943_03365 [Chloroflexi bacterium]|nr:hypothetical protein [Chloroflexota bacterium]
MTELMAISPEEVLEALRLWHGGDASRWPLAHLRLGTLISHLDEEHTSLADYGPAAHNRAILTHGLKILTNRMSEAEELLRDRFEHRRDVLAVANRLNISESSLYYRQRQAVNQLTEILVQLEENASTDWQQRMLTRYPLPSYNELIGIEKSRTAIIDAISNPNEHFIVVIDGIGGIGKTALADKISRDFLRTTHFNEIVWVTAKHTHLSTLGRLQIESGRPALTFSMLVDKLSTQLQLPQHNSQLQKQRLVKQFLQERHCLVIIDNLETVADYRGLLPELKKWQNPSKFLLTSRIRLIHEPGVYSISLKELDESDAIKLIRQEAKQSGFTSLLEANDDELKQIFEVVGGNPLALKLIIGQLRFHSLPRVLKRFGKKENQQHTPAGIFDYIYQEIWDNLRDNSKTTLIALTQAGESGFNFDHLVKVTGLPESSINQCLEELILISLVDLSGSLFDRRYRLHRLTEVFLLRMFAE